MHPIRLLNLNSLPPVETQSIYHALAKNMTLDSQDTLIICRPSAPYLCLGYHQVFENIFDADECQRRGLPVLRRRLGGGATYLDENQLFYQCIFHYSRMPAMLKDIYAMTLSAPVEALKRLGLNAELRDTNEIEVDGKRIAGTGGGRINEACVVVGNILFDFDFEALTAVWRTPSVSFKLLAEKALRQQLVTLNQLGVASSYENISELLIEEFSKSCNRPIQADVLTLEEIKLAEETAKELASSEFLSLHKERGDLDPMRSLKISARAFIHSEEIKLNGYQVRGSFWTTPDVIHETRLESTPANEWQAMEEKLRGIPFKEWREQVHVH